MKNFAQTAWNSFSKNWDAFWFGPMDLIQFASFRLVFSLLLFTFYLIRYFDYDFLFSSGGVFPYSAFEASIPAMVHSVIPWEKLVLDDAIGRTLYLCFLGGLLALAFGHLKRPWTFLLFVIHLAFIKRNPLALYGPDLVGTFWLFFLCFGNTGNTLKIQLRNPLAAFKNLGHETSDALTTLATRMIQIQLCIIYGYSGLEKAKGPTWWSGDAIWNVLGNGQLVGIDFSFLANLPEIIAFATFMTVIWETYFAVLVWIKALRPVVLFGGVLLHFAIGLTMGIPFFSAFMVATYLLFLDPTSVRRLITQVSNFLSKNKRLHADSHVLNPQIDLGR